MRAALLVMDCQRGLLDIIARHKDPTNLLKSTANAIKAARAANIPVIYTVSCLRPGYPDLCRRNMRTGRILQTGGFIQDDMTTQLADEITPRPIDPVVLKRRLSSFAGTDMGELLRSLQVDHLILAGVMTSGAVLSSVLAASDLDYVLTVVEDLCLDINQDSHDILMRNIFPSMAAVVQSSKWIASLDHRLS